MSYFSVAGIQMAPKCTDNLEEMATRTASVATRFPWIDLVLFPELAAFGPDRRAAQPLPGPAEEFFCALAHKHGIWLVPGSIYELRDGDIYNTTLVINREGIVVGRYSKMFPFLPYERGVEAGSEFLVFDVPDVGRFGISICYDIWFPETTRTLAWMGAEVILHPSLTNTLDRDVELAMVRACAAQNQCYVVDINTAGDPLGMGRSLFAGPDGEILHQAGTGVEIMPLELDLGRVRRCRERGLKGLGQPLKSFRDGPASYPVYSHGPAHSPYLAKLGALELPHGNVAAAHHHHDHHDHHGHHHHHKKKHSG